jgi:chaperonin GroES
MKHEEIKPIGDKILVKQAPAEEITKGGIYLPETSIEAPTYGIVVDTGLGKIENNGLRKHMTVIKGDKVYFTKNATIEVQHNGTEHLMMKEERVLLVEC